MVYAARGFYRDGSLDFYPIRYGYNQLLSGSWKPEVGWAVRERSFSTDVPFAGLWGADPSPLLV